MNLTGKRRYRVEPGLFGAERLILQVEEAGLRTSCFGGHIVTDHVHRWRDAASLDLTVHEAPAVLDAPPATTDGLRQARSEAEPLQNPDVEGSRGEIARQVRRFTLKHAPDGFRLFRDGERIEGPWSHQDVELAEQAWAEAVADAIRALSASPASPTVGGWREIAEDAAKSLEWVLASSTGKVWFQAAWDEDDGWVTFNRYYESDPRMPDRKWSPKLFVALPAPNRDADGLKAEGE